MGGSRNNAQAKRRTKSASSGKELYDRMRTFINYFAISDAISIARSSPTTKGVGSLEARVLVTARKFKERGAIAGEEIDTLEPVDKSSRVLNLDEGGLFPELVAGNSEPDERMMIGTRS
jgi:DNA recombination protein RmuC